MIELDSKKRVLVINLGGIGDVLLSQTSVAGLKRKYDCKIYMMVVPRAKGIVQRWDFIEGFYEFPVGKIIYCLRILFSLRKEKFDLAVNMRTIHSVFSGLKIKYILKIISPEFSAGRNTQHRASFFDMEIQEGEYDNIHELDYCIKQVNSLGVESFDEKFKLYLEDEDFNIKRRNKIKNYAVIHPGAAVKTKQWPVERFAQVVDYIVNCGIAKQIVITGTQEDREKSVYIKNKINGDVIDLTGKTSLMEAAAVVSKAKIFVTNDTGVMHMGAVLGVPMVAVFGPGDFQRYNPERISPNAAAFYTGEDCSPCEKKKCKDMRCVRNIEVSDVKDKINEIIQ
ncbi:MAG: glycosyltransferase family 9 protein [Atribacterota bacterium]